MTQETGLNKKMPTDATKATRQAKNDLTTLALHFHVDLRGEAFVRFSSEELMNVIENPKAARGKRSSMSRCSPTFTGALPISH